MLCVSSLNDPSGFCCFKSQASAFSSAPAASFTFDSWRPFTMSPVMPISGTIWPQPRSEAGTVVTPRLLSRKLTCHSGAAFGPALLSASKAYTLSCSVATKTTLWVAFPGIATFDRYSGCAYT